MQPIGQEPAPYSAFRCGLTFEEIRHELAHEQRQRKERGQYMWVTRKTVLGRMSEHKRRAYGEYTRWIGAGA